jgi:geranylgeranylglycerol-phosphate geranylgeranyltransferase
MRAGGHLRWLASLQAYLQLVRLPQSLIVMGGSLIGAELAGPASMSCTIIALVIASNTLLFSGSIAFNDWHDILEDGVNRPTRPIPSGRIARSHALGFAVALFVGATLLALGVGWQMGAFAAAVSVSSIGYSLRWKRVPLLGNVIVAALSAYPLWCWLALDSAPGWELTVLIPACIVFRVGAELVKTAEDYEGDRRAAIATVATCKGAAYANRLGLGLMCAALLVVLLFPQPSAVLSVALAGSLLLAMAAVVRVVKGDTGRHDESRRLVAVGRTIMILMVSGLLLHIGSS